MWDLVGNPEDRFSHNEAHYYNVLFVRSCERNNQVTAEAEGVVGSVKLFEPRCEKTGLRGFRPGPTQTGLYIHRRWLEA